MPVYGLNPADNVPQAMSTTPEYMFGTKIGVAHSKFVAETVSVGTKSRAVCLAPAVENHGVRGFIATVLWPEDATEGEVEVQGSDLNEEDAFHPLGTITFPDRQYSSPSGLVVNFMRLKVTVVPDPPQLAGRLTIR